MIRFVRLFPVLLLASCASSPAPFVAPPLPSTPSVTPPAPAEPTPPLPAPAPPPAPVVTPSPASAPAPAREPLQSPVESNDVSECLDASTPIDCERACEGYDRVIDDIARRRNFLGDRLSRGQCLSICRAPANEHERVQFACYVGARTAAQHSACVDRCRPH